RHGIAFKLYRVQFRYRAVRTSGREVIKPLHLHSTPHRFYYLPIACTERCRARSLDVKFCGGCCAAIVTEKGSRPPCWVSRRARYEARATGEVSRADKGWKPPKTSQFWRVCDSID